MKKLLVGLIAVCMFGFAGNAQNSVKVTVGCSIEIGRNSTGDCSRFGLCTSKTKWVIKIEQPFYVNKSVITGFKRDGLTTKEFNSIFTINNEKLFMYVNQENLDAIKNYVRADDFVIEEDFVFNNPEANIKNYVIKAGTYQFIFDNQQKLYYLSF